MGESNQKDKLMLLHRLQVGIDSVANATEVQMNQPKPLEWPKLRRGLRRQMI
jgi:hypothetical protein